MSATNSNSDDDGGPAFVVVVRHGERLDYVQRDRHGSNWVQQAKDCPELGHRPWDPPLTECGQDQARRLGRELRRRLGSLTAGEENVVLPPVSAVYTSPLLRCRQTACEIRRGLVEQVAVSEPSQPQQGDDELPPPTTSASSSSAFYGDGSTSGNIDADVVAKVRVEHGLVESLNEEWYNSWALPGSDGTWGYAILDRRQRRMLRVPDDLHPAACAPVQQTRILGGWRETEAGAAAAASSSDEWDCDAEYESVSRIRKAPFALHPPRFETRKEQQARMRETVEMLARPGQLIVVVSHGGPVVHLYETVTENPWESHGEPKYCCFSVYRLTRSAKNGGCHFHDKGVDHDGVNGNNAAASAEWKYDWEALAVNQSA